MLFLLVIAEVLEDLMGDIDFDDAIEALDDASSFSLSCNTVHLYECVPPPKSAS